MDNLHHSKETIAFNEDVKRTLEDAYISGNELKRTPVTNTDYKEKIEKFNKSKAKIETLIKQADTNFLNYGRKIAKLSDPKVDKDKYDRNVQKSNEQGENFTLLTECLSELNKISIQNSTEIVKTATDILSGKLSALEEDNNKNLTVKLETLSKAAADFNKPLQKSTFFNTSSSEKYAKTKENKTGAHVLGFFEAIGRAVLTPFIAIALAFTKDPVNYEEKITTYFDTIKHCITFEK